MNREMAKSGLETRVDLRSYKDMSSASDTPEGMIAQEHVGSKFTNLERKFRKTGEGPTRARQHRDEVRQTNDDLMSPWLTLRALERAKARADEAARLADALSARTKICAAAERAQLSAATTADACVAALQDGLDLHALDLHDPVASAIAAARVGADFSAGDPVAEFDQESDPETYVKPDTRAAPDNPIRVRRRGPRQRTRG